MRAGAAIRLFLFTCIAIVNVGSTRPIRAQLNEGAILVSDFFEELYQVGSNGGVTDLLDSPSFQEVPGQNLAIADDSTAYLSYFSNLYRFDVGSGQLTFVDELSFDPIEITIDAAGSLVAVGAGELIQIDPATGAETSIYDESFFTPRDAVTDEVGNIYLTEFFDALGVLSPAGAFSKIGNYATNQFRHLDLGPDGMLYLSTTFGASFYRIDPTDGSGVELDSDVFELIDDLQVDAAGDIIFSGQVDTRNGVFRFDPSTKAVTTLVDDTSVNGGFFDPRDVAIYAGSQSYSAADLDQDGDVDGGDLSFLVGAYGQSAAGDLNGDGDTDGADVLAWQGQFTQISVAATSSVPEPGTAWLMLTAAIYSGLRLRRPR